MTEKELRELDAEVHRKVMGCDVRRDCYPSGAPCEPRDLDSGLAIPRYSSDIAWAWQAVAQVQRRNPGWRFSLLGGDVSMGGVAGGVYQVREDWRVPFGWRAEFFGELDPRKCYGDRHGTGTGDAAPLAICRAALAAVETIR